MLFTDIEDFVRRTGTTVDGLEVLAAAGAFVIGGLREIGEPSRKALIVDLAEPTMRARTVGLYYLIRSVAIASS